jgi:hypothetical protein
MLSMWQSYAESTPFEISKGGGANVETLAACSPSPHRAAVRGRAKTEADCSVSAFITRADPKESPRENRQTRAFLLMHTDHQPWDCWMPQIEQRLI